jgi:nicotinate-nucleotide adenylyltransferase
MSRIGIFGGSFDPVHAGHTGAVESFLNSGLIDEVWVLLTPDPPHKQNKRQASYNHRLEMLKLAFGPMAVNGRVKVSTLEKDLPSPSYTLQTLRHFKKSYPGHNFFLCLGGDSILQFHTWYRFEEILKDFSLLAVERPGSDAGKADRRVLEKTIFVEHVPVDASSTFVREADESVEDQLPGEVEAYIREHGLYTHLTQH